MGIAIALWRIDVFDDSAQLGVQDWGANSASREPRASLAAKAIAIKAVFRTCRRGHSARCRRDFASQPDVYRIEDATMWLRLATRPVSCTGLPTHLVSAATQATK